MNKGLLSYNNFIFISKNCLLIGDSDGKYSKLVKNGVKDITYESGVDIDMSNTDTIKINKYEFELLRDLFYS